MKVAIVPLIRDWSWGAPGACIGALVKGLLSAGHEVLWLVAPIDLEHPEVLTLAAQGVKTVPLPSRAPTYAKFPGLRRSLFNWRRRYRSIAQLLEEFSPDHIFINQGGAWCTLAEGDLFAYLIAHPTKYSLIVHLNQPQILPRSLFANARDLVAKARIVYFNSAWVHQLAELQVCERIPNSLYFQYPLRFPIDSPLPWPISDIPRLVMINRLDAYHKGIDIALHAIAKLRSEGIALSLSIFGEGPDREYLSRLAAFLHITDCVTFHGHRSDVDQIWRTEELLLLPSRYEGLAVSMIEAMGLGRPVLRTPFGGSSEWIESGIDGYICPFPDVQSLYESLKGAIADRSRWRFLGLHAHEKVKRNLQIDPANVFFSSLD